MLLNCILILGVWCEYECVIAMPVYDRLFYISIIGKSLCIFNIDEINMF